jgi:hypothetical protein
MKVLLLLTQPNTAMQPTALPGRFWHLVATCHLSRSISLVLGGRRLMANR